MEVERDKEEAREDPGAMEQEPAVAEKEEPASLEKEVERYRAEAADYLDQLKRARADYANYKRRAEAERSELAQAANAYLILKILPALDDLDRAFMTLPHELASLTWVDGIKLIQRKLQVALESVGLTAIDVKGAKFDPALHEAISHEPSADHEDGDILGEAQKGYRLGDKVLRPSMVRVAKHVDESR